MALALLGILEEADFTTGKKNVTQDFGMDKLDITRST